MNYSLVSIGNTFANGNGFGIQVASPYRTALIGLEGFSHVQVIWWFSACDQEAARSKRTENKPYKQAPQVLGTFATRSPERPNPIALSTARMISIDPERGIISLAWLDAFDGSPVLDLKPYTPSADRVEAPQVPLWCRHWPKNVETSGDFDWENEFNF